MPKCTMPADLDTVAKRKYRELLNLCDPDVDKESMQNYARQHSTLLLIREERGRQQAAGTFTTMVEGRDKSQVLNPLLVHESRLVASLNRTLKLLGLTSPRDESIPHRKLESESPPPGFTGDEPSHGWPIEVLMCKGPLNQTAADIAEERLRDLWVAARTHQAGSRRD
jgi:hypothetical protein